MADLMLHYGGGPVPWQEMEFARAVDFHLLLQERHPQRETETS